MISFRLDSEPAFFVSVPKLLIDFIAVDSIMVVVNTSHSHFQTGLQYQTAPMAS